MPRSFFVEAVRTRRLAPAAGVALVAVPIAGFETAGEPASPGLPLPVAAVASPRITIRAVPVGRERTMAPRIVAALVESLAVTVVHCSTFEVGAGVAAADGVGLSRA